MKTQDLPKRGLAGLKAHFKDDFISGFSVSLIALPLCLGIAMASGLPPLAGIITAIVGGIFASRVSGTFVTISGPAAGLIVITLGAAESMGGAFAESGYAGYPHALGAIVIGGLIMALFGVLKVGKVGDFFPSAAVHGMLAAIGVIIMVKLLFPALGVDKPKGEILEVMTEIPHAFLVLHKNALIITLISLATLIIHPLMKIKIIKLIPAPMWVLLFTIPLAAYLNHDQWIHLNMVNLDGGLLNGGGLKLPSFAKIGESAFWVAVVGVALVSAIESLLSAKAVDTLDPYKRKSNLNKDLISMGAGSSLAAALGGLPMISEIVRSSANVNNGAKTQWANFYHGLFLLIYVIIGVSIIEMIPNAALASMLVFTGFKLAHPREFKHMAQIGKKEIVVFIITLVSVLATDLIIGILIGILASYIFLIVKGNPINNLFVAKGERKNETLKLEGYLTFSNYLSFKKKMDAILSDGDKLVLNFSDVKFIDHTVLHHIEDYSRNANLEGNTVDLVGLDNLIPLSSHPLAARDRNAKALLKNSDIAPRTLSLLSLAQTNGYEFKTKTANVMNWEFYTLTIRKKIISIENIISTKINGLVVRVADIKTQEGAETTIDFEKVTVLKIAGINNIPKFYMAKETFIDKIADAISGDDINFDSHLRFSKNYILKGLDEVKVRAFFTTEILDFFEANLDYYLVSNGDEIMLHHNHGFLNNAEITSLISKGKKLTQIIK